MISAAHAEAFEQRVADLLIEGKDFTWQVQARKVIAAVGEQVLRGAADAMTREEPGAGPWGTPQHEHQAKWLRERAATYRPAL